MPPKRERSSWAIACVVRGGAARQRRRGGTGEAEAAMRRRRGGNAETEACEAEAAMRRRQCGGVEAEARTGEGKEDAARRPVGEAEVVRRR